MTTDTDKIANECAVVIGELAAGKIDKFNAAERIGVLTYRWITTDIDRKFRSDDPDLPFEVHYRFLWRTTQYAATIQKNLAAGGSPRALLWTIAENITKDVLMSAKRRAAREDVLKAELQTNPPTSSPSPEAELLFSEAEQTLDRAVQQLPDDERATWVAYRDGVPVPAIATRSSRDAKRVRADIRRIKVKLERILRNGRNE